jgi:hypothetical protein
MKRKNYNAGLLAVFFLIYICIYILPKGLVHAIDMESGRFKIQFGTINTGSGTEHSTSYKVTSTLGQLAAAEFQSSGYIVKAGFQYIYSIIPFSFSVSDTTINLGELQPGIASIGNTTLTISFGASGQYIVTAIAETPLQTSTATTIPNTTCDGVPSSCNTTTAEPWTSSSAFGFGYSMSGQDIPTDFVNTSYYRPFPIRSLGGIPSIVMTNSNVGKGRQAVMTMKANISSIQGAGTYQTIINYVATPTF